MLDTRLFLSTAFWLHGMSTSELAAVWANHMKLQSSNKTTHGSIFGNLESLGWACKLLCGQWWFRDGLHLGFASFLLGSLRGLLGLYEEAQFSQIMNYTPHITPHPDVGAQHDFPVAVNIEGNQKDFMGLKYCHAPVPLHLCFHLRYFSGKGQM